MTWTTNDDKKLITAKFRVFLGSLIGRKLYPVQEIKKVKWLESP